MALVIILCALAVYAFAKPVHAEQNADWKPAIVGTGLLLAPIPVCGNGLEWGHAIELEGFSYAETDIVARFLPENVRPVAPFLCFFVNTIYRVGELSGGKGDDLVIRKAIADDLGIVGWVSINIKF